MKKRIVIANWKMYVESPRIAEHFLSILRQKSRLYSGVEVIIAPSSPLIGAVSAVLKGSQIKTCAQTLSAFTEPKHTGEVSAATLKAVGVTHVIVGHSERRALGEKEETVGRQISRAVEAGLTVVLCVGERERDVSGAHFTLITEQLSSALAHVPPSKSNKLIVTYEPVWAIGKSAAEAMKPSELREMSIFIKKTLAERFERKAALRVPILYGGSVEPGNAPALIAEGNVSGFLVGHASADVSSFLEILKACKK